MKLRSHTKPCKFIKDMIFLRIRLNINDKWWVISNIPMYGTNMDVAANELRICGWIIMNFGTFLLIFSTKEVIDLIEN